MLPPINFKNWIEENRHLLKPPVGNKVVYEDAEFIIMVVGGPNARKDYHVNQSEEFFYQIEGDIGLKLLHKGEFTEVTIKEGEIFLLPGKIPHSPQRPENTVGLVVERKRNKDELDGFQWYCEKCHHKLYEEFFHLTNIVTQLPPLFKKFWENDELTKCNNCGAVLKES